MRGQTVAEYEFEVTEPLVTSQTYFVNASTRAEALQKVHDHGYEFVETNHVYPRRIMTVRDVKRGGRITDRKSTDSRNEGESNG